MLKLIADMPDSWNGPIAVSGDSDGALETIDPDGFPAKIHAIETRAVVGIRTERIPIGKPDERTCLLRAVVMLSSGQAIEFRHRTVIRLAEDLK